MVAGATRSSQNVILGIFCLITVFFAVVRVRDTFIDRQIVKASELNRQFMEHLEQINIEQEERAAFVQISHEGNPELHAHFVNEAIVEDSKAVTTTSIPMTSAVNKTFTTNAEMAAFEMSHCNDEFRIFETGRTRVAITSFPGSGNTWTRHLLHMATGYWTGNAKSSEKLKRAGWKAEDIPCIEGKTIAIKTHKWHTMKKCVYEKAMVLIRNPFYALVAEFNRQMASKTGEIDTTLFHALGWDDFVVEYSREYFAFFQDWFIRYKNPHLTICFEGMVKDPRYWVKEMLDFIEFPDFRLDCIFTNLEGEFHREHHVHQSHIKLFSTEQKGRIFSMIEKLSDLFRRSHVHDCTQFFNYTGITD